MEQSKTKYTDAVEFVENRIDRLSNSSKSYQRAGEILSLKNERHMFELFDMLCMVQIGANSMTEMYVRNMIREVRKTPEYLKMGNKHRLELMEQDLDRYIKALCKALGRRSENKGYDPMQFQASLADMADASDEAIKPLATELQEFWTRHTPKGGECSPREPELLNAVMMANVMSIVSALVSEFAIKELPDYFHTTSMQFMNLQILMNRVKVFTCSLYDHLAKNKFGTPLRINIGAIMDHPDMKGHRDSEGKWVSGLLPRLRDLYFSTRYIDLLYIARDGSDLHLRDYRPSLVSNLSQSKDISLPSQAI